jgi:hypothetical protein
MVSRGITAGPERITFIRAVGRQAHLLGSQLGLGLSVEFESDDWMSQLVPESGLARKLTKFISINNII